MITAAEANVERLYHYQKTDVTWLDQIINGNKIRFSNPSDFNDPWDCKPHYDTAIFETDEGKEKFIKYVETAHRKHHPELTEVREKIIPQLRKDKNFFKQAAANATNLGDTLSKQYKVYCLSKKSNCPLMWSHYSDKHKGVCLEFSARNLVFGLALRVEYLQDYPSFDFTDDSRNVLLPLTAKSDHWKYEDEYRLIAQEKVFANSRDTLVTENNFLQIPTTALSALIIGCMAKEDDVDAAKEIIKKSGRPIILKRAIRYPNKYGLDIQTI